MKKFLIAVLMTGALSLVACGGDDELCGINLSGAKICGQDAAAYCDLIDGYSSDDTDTNDFCNEVSEKYSGTTSGELDELINGDENP